MRHRNTFAVSLAICLAFPVFCIPPTAIASPASKPTNATIAQAGELAPEDIIRRLYAGYMGSNSPSGSSEDVIRPFASRALRKAIDMENRCKSNSGEICAIDFDCIIVGQDWGELFDFRITRLPTASGLKLQVSFREKNMVPSHHVVTYSFVREDGAWRIDNVDDDGNWKLREAIESYFKKYDEKNSLRKPHN